MGLCWGLMGKIKKSYGVAGNLHVIICLNGKNQLFTCFCGSRGFMFDSVMFYFLIIVCVPPFEKILVNE